jgi:ankyrin repeat protein
MKDVIHKLEGIEKINTLKLQESIIDQTVDQEIKLQNEIEIVNQFINSFDFDQTTPLIFALKNQRKNVIKILLENQKTCLTMRNLRFGSPLHVAFNNLDYKSAIIILNSIIKNQKFLSNSIEAFNYQDEEGNTPLHLVMKNFNIESEKS